MKKITVKELKSILESHKLWRETLGEEGIYANLGGANLTGANLRGANLTGANLSGANLICANLTSAYLRYTDLQGANLEYANLTEAFLSGADLGGAFLGGSCLRYADLTDADLTGADLYCANLTGADLTNTVLDEKKKEETKMNMENENGFILSSEEKDMVLEYRKKTAKEKKINEIRQTATALLNSFRAIDQIAGGGTYCLDVELEANTELLQQVLRLFGTVNQRLHCEHSSDGRLWKRTLSFAMPSLD